MKFVPVALFLTIVQSSKSNNLQPEYDYDNRLEVDPYQAFPNDANDAIQLTGSKVETNALDDEHVSYPVGNVPGSLENPYQEVEEVSEARPKKHPKSPKKPKKTVQPTLDENVLGTEADTGLYIATESNSQMNIEQPPLHESVTDKEVNNEQESTTLPSWQSASTKKSKKNKKVTPTTTPAVTIEKPALDESEIGVEFNNGDQSTTELSSHFIASTKKSTKKKKVTPTPTPEVTVVEQQLEDSVLDKESNNGDQLTTESILQFTPSEIKSNKRKKLTSISTPVIALAERLFDIEDNSVNQSTTELSQQYAANTKKANKKEKATPISAPATAIEEPPLDEGVVNAKGNYYDEVATEPTPSPLHSTKQSSKRKKQTSTSTPAVTFVESKLEESVFDTQDNQVVQSTAEPSWQFTLSTNKSSKKKKVTTTLSPIVTINGVVIDGSVVVTDSHTDDQSAIAPSPQDTASTKKSSRKKMVTSTSATTEKTEKIIKKEPSAPSVENNVILTAARASNNESHDNNTYSVAAASQYVTVSSSDKIDQNTTGSLNANVPFEQLNETTNYKKLSVAIKNTESTDSAMIPKSKQTTESNWTSTSRNESPQSTDSRIQKMKKIENYNPESISTTQTYGTTESVSFSTAFNETVASPKWNSTVSSKRPKLKTTKSSTPKNRSPDSTEPSVKKMIEIKIFSPNLLSTTQTYQLDTATSVSLSNEFDKAATRSTWSPKFSSVSGKPKTPTTPEMKKIRKSSSISTSTNASPGSTKPSAQGTEIVVSVRSTLTDKFALKSNPVEQQSTTAPKSKIRDAASTLSSVTKSPTTVTQESQSVVKEVVSQGSFSGLHAHSQAHREVYLSKCLMMFVGFALLWYL